MKYYFCFLLMVLIACNIQKVEENISAKDSTRLLSLTDSIFTPEQTVTNFLK